MNVAATPRSTVAGAVIDPVGGWFGGGVTVMDTVAGAEV